MGIDEINLELNLIKHLFNTYSQKNTFFSINLIIFNFHSITFLRNCTVCLRPIRIQISMKLKFCDEKHILYIGFEFACTYAIYTYDISFFYIFDVCIFFFVPISYHVDMMGKIISMRQGTKIIVLLFGENLNMLKGDV